MIYLVTLQQELFGRDDYKVISAQESLDMIKDWKFIQFDTETDSTEARIGNLLTMQLGDKKTDTQIVVDCSTICPRMYKAILEEKLLIGHNLKFDLQWMYNFGIIPRKVYDTMIVEQMLYLGYPSGVKHYSLQAVAQERIHVYLDKTVRGEIIWRGLDTATIKYAANDVKYLEDIMWSQVKECKKKDCLKGAKVECDFTPAIAYLEWCGIKLDEKKWKEKMANDSHCLKEAKGQLDDWLVNWDTQKRYWHVNTQGDLFAGFSLDPIVDINWDSSQQVTKICKELGFNTTVQDKKTGEDKDSVLEKTLKSQKGINDIFLDMYFRYKEYSKVCSTYGNTYLNAINPNTGRIHTTFRALGAASGRMACGSNNPNVSLARLKGLPPSECIYPQLQNLPADEETRACFVAERGNLLCDCDFSALESRLGADIYNEPAMLEEFLHGGGDMHSLCAKMVFKDELKDIAVKDVKKQRPDLRKKVKSVEFAKQFGGSAIAISGSLGCSLEEAEGFSNAYDEGFKGVTEFGKKGSKFVRENGYVLMCKHTGHKMWWWDHKHWLEEQASYTPEFWDEYRASHKGTGDLVSQEVKQHFQAASKWDRMALNSPTQGTGIIILKDATTELFNIIVDNGYFGRILICNLVHDETLTEAPEEIMPWWSKKVEEVMLNSAAKYCKSLPIPAEAEVDTCWKH